VRKTSPHPGDEKVDSLTANELGCKMERCPAVEIGCIDVLSSSFGVKEPLFDCLEYMSEVLYFSATND
jgi:hypothetical protein